MIQFALSIIFFTDIISYLIILDIILSWLSLLWLRWRPEFLKSIVDPLYSFIGKIVPTSFWIFRFDALIAMVIIYFIQGLLLISIPWLGAEVLRLTSYL
jgi:uncharacterized protein YggT (Ycf19 family)